jgi:hypothetical protein
MPARRRNVENKKINVLFCSTLIIVLAGFIFLIKDFNARRANDFKEYTASVTNLIKRDNNKIKILYNQLMAQQKELIVQQKENAILRNTLAETRNGLDALTKKLIQPMPVAAVTSIPAPASASAVATK